MIMSANEGGLSTNTTTMQMMDKLQSSSKNSGITMSNLDSSESVGATSPSSMHLTVEDVSLKQNAELLLFDDSWMIDVSEDCNKIGEFKDDLDVVARAAEMAEEEKGCRVDARSKSAQPAAQTFVTTSSPIAATSANSSSVGGNGDSMSRPIISQEHDSCLIPESSEPVPLRFDDSWMTEISEDCNQFGECKDDQDVLARLAEESEFLQAMSEMLKKSVIDAGTEDVPAGALHYLGKD